jgi:hypothetical protein
MKKNKIKEVISKVGQLTLPAMMLMSVGAWNSNFIQSATEQSTRTQKQTQPKVEITDNGNGDIILANSWNFEGDCYGCESSCGGCTGGCTGCSGGCTGCTGCSISCEGGAGQLY